MTESQSALWQRLDEFSIDSGDEAFTFARRLSRENGWDLTFSQRVILEYKRFVFVSMVAGHSCTPSDHVDQAWHLHLTYTKSYWEGLCQTILPRPLHHNPTKGGQAEDDKFDDWYTKTLESYASLFGEPAPNDIWPPADLRFGVDPFAQRVNLKRYWVVPKRPLKRALVITGLLAASVLVAGCTADQFGTSCIVLAGVLLFGVVIYALINAARNGAQSGNGSSGSGCGDGGSGFFDGGSGGCGASGCGSSGCGSGCGGGGCGGGCGGG